MAQEIERKYRIKQMTWKQGTVGVRIQQGYLSTDPERTVRIRLTGEKGLLTIKGRTEGFTRAEYEYAIPAAEALQLLSDLCVPPLIEKTRYRVPYAGHIWEVDVFEGVNAGLVLAEIELPDEETPFEVPEWVGEEVSHDPRYFNAYLALYPYSTWE